MGSIIKQASQIRIYPNPSTQTFNVYNSSGFTQKPVVYNMMGQQIRVKCKKIGASHYKINLSGFPKGIYIIKIGAVVKRMVLE